MSTELQFMKQSLAGEKEYWRRARQPIPVFLPGESHGQRIPWTGNPGKLQSIGSHKVGHD